MERFRSVPEMESLPAFPKPAMPAWLAEALASVPAAIAFRSAERADLSFLRALYAQSREPELAQVTWPIQAKQAFCDSQFDLQHRHYILHAPPTAAFLVMVMEAQPIGRLYLHWSTDELRIVDILVERAHRGRGLGSMVIRGLQAAVSHAGLITLSLHVAEQNHQALRLYRRLGFGEGERRGAHLRMDWSSITAGIS